MMRPQLRPDFFLAPDDGGAGGGGGGGTETATGGGGGGGGGGGASGAGESGSTFQPITSQEELDRVLSRRLTRERTKFADYDELKGKAAKYDELEQSQKTELEKEREARAAAERDRESARIDAQEARLERAVVTAASKRSVVDTDAVYALLDRSKVTYDEDGKPNNLDELVEELVKAKPYLVGKTSSPGTGGGGARTDQAGDGGGSGWIRDSFAHR